MEDEDTQRKGVVGIVYMNGLPTIPTKLLNTLGASSAATQPLSFRHCSQHICYDNAHLQPVFSFLHAMTSEQGKLRTRYTFGSHLECIYSLRSFGVPLGEDLPNRASMDRYIEQRKQMDQDYHRKRKEEESETGIILYPEGTDILVGRGKPYQVFAGNLLFNDIVSAGCDEYASNDDRFDKTLFSMRLVQSLQDDGCRFLERVEKLGWKVVTDQVARKKVIQALGRRLRNGKNPLETPSTTIPTNQNNHNSNSSSGSGSDGGGNDPQEVFSSATKRMRT